MRPIILVGPELEENLGLRYLASSLEEAGFRSEIVPFNHGAELSQVAQRIADRPEPPLLIALSLAFQLRAPDILALALELRARGITAHVTVGGHFATFAASELLRDFPELDSVCRHEAEELIVELAQALTEGRSLESVAGLATRNALGEPVLGPFRAPPDLARLPCPDRRGEWPQLFGQSAATLVGSRGCYARCSFCCIAEWHEQTLPGRRFRLRDPDDARSGSTASPINARPGRSARRRNGRTRRSWSPGGRRCRGLRR